MVHFTTCIILKYMVEVDKSTHSLAMPNLNTLHFHGGSCSQVLSLDMSLLPSLTSVIIDDAMTVPYQKSSFEVLRSFVVIGNKIG